jgi:hypothetical protein
MYSAVILPDVDGTSISTNETIIYYLPSEIFEACNIFG